MDIMQPPLSRNRSRSLSPTPTADRQQRSSAKSAARKQKQIRQPRLSRQRSHSASRDDSGTAGSRERRRAKMVARPRPGTDGSSSGGGGGGGGGGGADSRIDAGGGGGGGGAKSSPRRGGVAAAAAVAAPPPRDDSSDAGGVTRVRVFCRIRPQNEEELRHAGGECVRLSEKDAKEVHFGDADRPATHSFTFDRCFGQGSTNKEIFERVGRPLVDSALRGVNGAVLCYGQTGAGKTFTMFGSGHLQEDAAAADAATAAVAADAAEGGSGGGATKGDGGGAAAAAAATEGRGGKQGRRDGKAPPHVTEAQRRRFENRGLVVQSMTYLFGLREKGVLTKSVKIDVCISCLEVYQNRLYDLLGQVAPEPDAEPSDRPFKRPELEIFQDKTNDIAISSAKKVPVKSVKECAAVITTAWDNRRVGRTDMNAHSSRSHCLILLSVGSYEVATKTGRFAQLYMVDLAGSEIVSKTKAEGLRLEEAKQINKSLLTLGIIVNKLSVAAALGAAGAAAKAHIPYRDSKLTRLLQNSFGGSAKTFLLVNVSPSVFNDSETLSTLRFASRAARITNHVEARSFKSLSDLKDILRQLQDDHLRLEGQEQELQLTLLLLDGFLECNAPADLLDWLRRRDAELAAARAASGSTIDAKIEAASGSAALRGRFDPRTHADEGVTRGMVRAQDVALERAKSEILRLAEVGNDGYSGATAGRTGPMPHVVLPEHAGSVTHDSQFAAEQLVWKHRAALSAIRRLQAVKRKAASGEEEDDPELAAGAAGKQQATIDPMERGMRLFARFRPVIAIEDKLGGDGGGGGGGAGKAGGAGGTGGGGETRPTSLTALGIKVVDEVGAAGKTARTVRVKHSETGKATSVYHVQDAFAPDVDQRTCFGQVAKPLLQVLAMGRNAAIIAYGQTGSGKTYTMFGEEKDVAQHGATGRGPSDGIVPRLLADMFQWIASSKAAGVNRALRMSFVQVYLENVLDLVPDPRVPAGPERCRVCKMRPCHCVKVKMMAPGITGTTAFQHDVDDLAQAMQLVRRAVRGRATGATGSNEESSRSHLIIQVFVLSEDVRTGTEARVQLDLVDLAGSEKISKTNATGDRLDEAKSINRSLYALTGCIDAITKEKQRVPYGDSKLTRLLSSALGGDALTSIVLNLSPHLGNRRETLSTLDFGDKVNRVRCRPVLHHEVSAESLNNAIRLARLRTTKVLGSVEAVGARVALRRNVVAQTADRHPASVFGLAVEAFPDEFLSPPSGAAGNWAPATRSASSSALEQLLQDEPPPSAASFRPRRATALSRYFLVQSQYSWYHTRIFTFVGLDTAAFVAPVVCRHWARWLLARPQPHFWRALLHMDARVSARAGALHAEHVEAKRAVDEDPTTAARRHLRLHPSPYDYHGALALATASRDEAWAAMPDLTGDRGGGVTLTRS